MKRIVMRRRGRRGKIWRRRRERCGAGEGGGLEQGEGLCAPAVG
jgi:hypothetical protein